MSNFYINSRVSITPIEELIGVDGSDKSRIVHSSIDKIFSSEYEKTVGTTATDLDYTAYTTTASGVDLGTIATIAYGSATYLFVKIVSAASSSTPNVYISLDNGSSYDVVFAGVGNWVKFEFSGLAVTSILFKSSDAATTANIEILVAV
jgi:hypothetical protein